MKTKRFPFSIAVALFAAMAFFACGGDGDTNANNGDNPPSEAAIIGYCDYGPVKADGTGGCYPMATDEDEANCTAWGNVVSSCPANTYSSSGGSSSSIPSSLSSSSSIVVSVQCPSYNPDTHFCDSRDGKIYKKITLGLSTSWFGSITWMAENLNYNANGSKCYDNDALYCERYGRLYDWAMAKTVCPSGWSLPANGAWDWLFSYADGTLFDGESGFWSENPYKSYTAGSGLKAASFWKDPFGESSGGTDGLDFSALPGGHYHSYSSSFYGVNTNGLWWSSDGHSSTDAYYRSMSYASNADWDTYEKSNLLSVRCIKD